MQKVSLFCFRQRNIMDCCFVLYLHFSVILHLRNEFENHFHIILRFLLSSRSYFLFCAFFVTDAFNIFQTVCIPLSLPCARKDCCKPEVPGALQNELITGLNMKTEEKIWKSTEKISTSQTVTVPHTEM